MEHETSEAGVRRGLNINRLLSPGRRSAHPKGSATDCRTPKGGRGRARNPSPPPAPTVSSSRGRKRARDSATRASAWLATQSPRRRQPTPRLTQQPPQTSRPLLPYDAPSRDNPFQQPLRPLSIHPYPTSPGSSCPLLL